MIVQHKSLNVLDHVDESPISINFVNGNKNNTKSIQIVGEFDLPYPLLS